jgi:hypothetical protein
MAGASTAAPPDLRSDREDRDAAGQLKGVYLRLSSPTWTGRTPVLGHFAPIRTSIRLGRRRRAVWTAYLQGAEGDINTGYSRALGRRRRYAIEIIGASRKGTQMADARPQGHSGDEDLRQVDIAIALGIRLLRVLFP